MEREGRSDRSTAIEDRFAGYEVYDQAGEKIGKVDDLFVDENDRPEYVGVKMGLLGTRSTLIPIDIVRVNDKRRLRSEEHTSELQSRQYLVCRLLLEKKHTKERPLAPSHPCTQG